MLRNKVHHISINQINNEVTINKFGETQQYTILEKIRTTPEKGHAVLNYLYINPGYEEDFERVFLNRDHHLRNTEGFQSLLFLRPKDLYIHYVIITIWTDTAAYKNWKSSREYKASHQKRGTKEGADHNIINRSLSFNISVDLSSEF